MQVSCAYVTCHDGILAKYSVIWTAKPVRPRRARHLKYSPAEENMLMDLRFPFSRLGKIWLDIYSRMHFAQAHAAWIQVLVFS